jgi:galactose-1-phosphate uridylyltransferase
MGFTRPPSTVNIIRWIPRAFLSAPLALGTVRKFMVSYEMLAIYQRDITPEQR